MTVSTKDDFECVPPCSDGITELAWSPSADYLAVSSWDGQTRVYEVQAATRGSLAKTTIAHEGPVFSTAWSPDGTKLASVGSDKSIRVLDLSTGQTIVHRDAHSAPIRACRWAIVGGAVVLITGGWDKAVKYWMVSGMGLSAMGTLTLPERCFAMDCAGSLLVIATAERHSIIVDLSTNPLQPARPPFASNLKMQTRAIACFPDGSGFVLGSVEGRAGVQHIDPLKTTSNFAFKCHRDATTSYGVNAIRFHPKYGITFATAGSDGVVAFWDKESRQRLDLLPPANTPISAISFSRDGSLLAYAISYDWSGGHEQYSATAKNSVMIHRLSDSEVRPRPNTATFASRRR